MKTAVLFLLAALSVDASSDLKTRAAKLHADAIVVDTHEAVLGAGEGSGSEGGNGKAAASVRALSGLDLGI